jgi:hypothetical protein
VRRIAILAAGVVAAGAWPAARPALAQTVRPLPARTAVVRPIDYGGWFGGALDLDGSVLVVGAERHSLSDGARGAAFVYEHVGNRWVGVAKLRGPLRSQASAFGYAVGVDGDTIIAGDPDQSLPGMRSNGAAYIFERTTGGWNQSQVLRATTPTIDGRFGRFVSISGGTALVNSGRGVQAFEKLATGWTAQTVLTPSIPDQFHNGFGLTAMKIEGDVALIGGSVYDGVDAAGRELIDSGPRVFAFERDGDGWRQTAMLMPSDPVYNGGFGTSLDFSGDVAIIGRPAGGPAFDGPHRGAAYIFQKYGDDWIQTAKLQPRDGFPSDGFGFRVAISGDRAAVLADQGEAGRVYLFANRQGAWREVGAIGTGVNFDVDQFGLALAMDGDRLAAGARLDGAVEYWHGAAYVMAVPEPAASAAGLIAAAAWAGVARRTIGAARGRDSNIGRATRARRSAAAQAHTYRGSWSMPWRGRNARNSS